jgi:dTDP-4-dehydrorhamnose reductase
MRMVSYQVNNPTWCRTVAKISTQILATENDYIRGCIDLYHLVGDGFASRSEWTQMI